LAALAVFSAVQLLIKWKKDTFKGWWREVVRPLALWACVQVFVFAASYIGNAGYQPSERPKGALVVMLWFLVFFPIVMVPVILLLRFDAPASAAPPQSQPPTATEAQAEALHAVKGEE
jgi:hypothetical protein